MNDEQQNTEEKNDERPTPKALIDDAMKREVERLEMIATAADNGATRTAAIEAVGRLKAYAASLVIETDAKVILAIETAKSARAARIRAGASVLGQLSDVVGKARAAVSDSDEGEKGQAPEPSES